MTQIELTIKLQVIMKALLLTMLLVASVTQLADSKSIDLDAGLATTDIPAPTAYLENSAEAAATTDESEEDDSICYSCHEQVEEAKELIRVQLEMVKKQNAFIRQKQKASSQKMLLDSSSGKQNRDRVRRGPRVQDNNNNNTSLNSSTPTQTSAQISTTATTTTTTIQPTIPATSSSVISRTLNDAESKFTVVSRLRVARSTDDLIMPSIDRSSLPKKSRDPVLKQMKHNQLQQLNETCKALDRLDGCLKAISRRCLGDLQFHSLESVVAQWLKKFDCSARNNPKSKSSWAALIRSVPEIKEKSPQARPISTPEETQRKLDEILGGGDRSSSTSQSRGQVPFGVMLKPTLTQSASQRFNTIQQQQQYSPQSVYSSQMYHFKSGRYLMSQENGSQPRYTFDATTRAIASQLFIIPCFLVILIAMIIVTNHYFRRSQKIHEQT